MNFEKAKDYILERIINELDEDLFYHNVDHTIDVINSSKRIALLEGVKGEELFLVMTAAAYHDSGMINSYEEHEEASVRIVKSVLPDFGYTEKEIEKVSELILATKSPQKANTLLEKVICDADLDYLGREDYFVIANKLKKEWAARGIFYTDLEWYKIQLEFLQEHEYFTSSSKKIYDDKKKENIISILRLIENS